MSQAWRAISKADRQRLGTPSENLIERPLVKESKWRYRPPADGRVSPKQTSVHIRGFRSAACRRHRNVNGDCACEGRTNATPRLLRVIPPEPVAAKNRQLTRTPEPPNTQARVCCIDLAQVGVQSAAY